MGPPPGEASAIGFFQRVGDGLLPGESATGSEGALEGFLSESCSQVAQAPLVVSNRCGRKRMTNGFAQCSCRTQQANRSLRLAARLRQLGHSLQTSGGFSPVADLAAEAETLGQMFSCCV